MTDKSWLRRAAACCLLFSLAMPPIAILTYVFAHKVFPISRIVQAKKGD